MKLVNPSVIAIKQDYNSKLKGIYEIIERCGRVCYKSEDKITEDSSVKFVEKLIKSGHTSVAEHATIYLKIPFQLPVDDIYYVNPYSKAKVGEDLNTYVTTNYRVILENKLEKHLQWLCDPTEYHYKRSCYIFTCNRGVSHEYVRHRKASFSQESTRYCNYNKGKFNNEITCIIPDWLTDIKEGSYKEGFDSSELSIESSRFIEMLIESENNYFELLDNETDVFGWTAQKAREILPNALKTDLIMTAFDSDWEYFIKLRHNSSAHPEAFKLAAQLAELRK